MKVSPATWHGIKGWKVVYQSLGKEKKRYFRLKEDADDFARFTKDQIKEHGHTWEILTPIERSRLAEAWQRAKEQGYTIAEACQAFEERGHKRASGLTLKSLCDQFIEAKTAKGLRPESLRQLKLTTELFWDGRATIPASSITMGDINSWIGLHDWGAWRRRGVVIDLNNLFRWGCKARLIEHNPMDGIERPRIDHQTPVVLSVDRARSLLTLCRTKYKPCLPWLVLGLFGGIRNAEIERLSWSDIGKDHVTIGSNVAKLRARRLVTINPTLRAWLKVCKRGKRVCSPSHAKRGLLRDEFGGLEKNVLRKSFISYELARSKDVQAVALECGNSADVIFRHYREVVTPKASREFWALMP